MTAKLYSMRPRYYAFWASDARPLGLDADEVSCVRADQGELVTARGLCRSTDQVVLLPAARGRPLDTQLQAMEARMQRDIAAFQQERRPEAAVEQLKVAYQVMADNLCRSLGLVVARGTNNAA